jgi:hypothetical protein
MHCSLLNHRNQFRIEEFLEPHPPALFADAALLDPTKWNVRRTYQ